MRAVFVSNARTKRRTCPVCKTVLDGAAGMRMDGPLAIAEPQPGNITLCAVCQSILIVTAVSFRVAVSADIDRLDPDVRKILLELQQQMAMAAAAATVSSWPM